MYQVTQATPAGTVAQRTTTTTGQKTIFDALQLREPPRFLHFNTS